MFLHSDRWENKKSQAIGLALGVPLTNARDGLRPALLLAEIGDHRDGEFLAVVGLDAEVEHVDGNEEADTEPGGDPHQHAQNERLEDVDAQGGVVLLVFQEQEDEREERGKDIQ